jgi:hypothetical protein
MRNLGRRLARGEPAVDFGALKVLARCTRPGHAPIRATRPYEILNKFLKAMFFAGSLGLPRNRHGFFDCEKSRYSGPVRLRQCVDRIGQKCTQIAWFCPFPELNRLVVMAPRPARQIRKIPLDRYEFRLGACAGTHAGKPPLIKRITAMRPNSKTMARRYQTTLRNCSSVIPLSFRSGAMNRLASFKECQRNIASGMGQPGNLRTVILRGAILDAVWASSTTRVSGTW